MVKPHAPDWRGERSERDFCRLLLRRVAHANVGTTLRYRLQREVRRLRRQPFDRQHETQLAAVGLHLAEKFVLLDLARRQLRRVDGYRMQVSARNLNFSR